MHVDGAAAEERSVHDIGHGHLDPLPRVGLGCHGAQTGGVVERPGEGGEQELEQGVEPTGRQVAGRELRADPGNALIPETHHGGGQAVVTRERRREALEDGPVAFVNVPVVADPGAQAMPALGLRRERLDRLGGRADPSCDLAGQAAEHVLLPREVLVEGHSRAARPLADAGDAALMKAHVAEELQGGVEDALPGALPARAHLRVVGERGASQDRFGVLTLGDRDAAMTSRHVRTSLALRRATRHRSPAGVTGTACRQESARTLSLTAGTIGGASFQFGSPLSSLATG